MVGLRDITERIKDDTRVWDIIFNMYIIIYLIYIISSVSIRIVKTTKLIIVSGIKIKFTTVPQIDFLNWQLAVKIIIFIFVVIF